MGWVLLAAMRHFYFIVIGLFILVCILLCNWLRGICGSGVEGVFGGFYFYFNNSSHYVSLYLLLYFLL